MVSTASLVDRVRDSTLLVVFALTAGILFLGGVTAVYQSVLGATLANTFTLSPVEWVVFAAGSFLVEPVLLFGTLYYAGTRVDGPLPLGTLLTGLGVAVVAGSLLGQLVGVRLWVGAGHSNNDVPLLVAWRGLFVLDPRIVGYWRVLVEPLARDFLTALAALGLARMRG